MAITSPRASARGFRIAPPSFYGDIDSLLKTGDLKPIFRQVIEWQRQTAEVLNGAMDGNLNVVGTVTLTASATSTTLSDRRIGPDSVILAMPTTANAATAQAALYQTYPNATREQAVLNHASSADADQTFAFAILG
jgi:hypothetical protein